MYICVHIIYIYGRRTCVAPGAAWDGTGEDSIGIA